MPEDTPELNLNESLSKLTPSPTQPFNVGSVPELQSSLLNKVKPDAHHGESILDNATPLMMLDDAFDAINGLPTAGEAIDFTKDPMK